MSGKPGPTTSNYGWALWHLEEADKTDSLNMAIYHTGAAQARAALAQIDAQYGPPPGTTWSS